VRVVCDAVLVVCVGIFAAARTGYGRAPSLGMSLPSLLSKSLRAPKVSWLACGLPLCWGQPALSRLTTHHSSDSGSRAPRPPSLCSICALPN